MMQQPKRKAQEADDIRRLNMIEFLEVSADKLRTGNGIKRFNKAGYGLCAGVASLS